MAGHRTPAPSDSSPLFVRPPSRLGRSALAGRQVHPAAALSARAQSAQSHTIHRSGGLPGTLPASWHMQRRGRPSHRRERGPRRPLSRVPSRTQPARPAGPSAGRACHPLSPDLPLPGVGHPRSAPPTAAAVLEPLDGPTPPAEEPTEQQRTGASHRSESTSVRLSSVLSSCHLCHYRRRHCLQAPAVPRGASPAGPRAPPRHAAVFFA